MWLGGRDSNPGSQLQRLVSYQLDDPRMSFTGQIKIDNRPLAIAKR